MRTVLLLLLIATITTADILLLRSEYEKVGYELGTLPAHTILNGNEQGYFDLDSNGLLTIAKEIPDTFNVLTNNFLRVTDGTDTIDVTIADGYDFILLNHRGTILNKHQEIDTLGEWTAYNNLWGDGTAEPEKEYRTAILLNDSLPQEVTFLWDTPGAAKDFGGSSVWSYTNLMFGNRYGLRDDLAGFPFKIDDLTELTMDFNYKPLIGDDQWKVALNMFLTDSDTLSPFSENRGDFFMVFDQKGTWIPPYPDTVIADTTLLEKPFTFLYKNDESGYEWRRIIIKDNNRLQQGSLDLLSLFNRFAAEGKLKKEQSIPNIQFGVEVTSGWGGIQVQQLSINKKMKGTESILSPKSYKREFTFQMREKGISLSLEKAQTIQILSASGRVLFEKEDFTAGIVGRNLPPAIYILRVGNQGQWYQQKITLQ